MADYGLTPSGFLIKPLSAVLADMQAVELSEIGPNLNLQPPDPLAVLTGVGASMIAELWQVVGAVYSGIDPDIASGDQLTGISLITGTVRLDPSDTQVIGCTVNVDPGTYLAGTLFANPVGNPSALFTNKTDVVNGGGVAADETVDFVAVNAGPTQVLANTLTQISQAVTGWNSVTNPDAGVPGTNEESDPDLRVRRSSELQASGASTAAAIKSDVLAKMVTPTTTSNTLACTVLYNDTDATDANGLPPHSVEVIAYQPGFTGADDIALADLILDDKAAGVGTHGLNSATGTDSQGNTETISFTRPVATPIYVAVTVLTDPAKFTGNADTIRAALTAYANGEWQPGVDVYVKATQSALFQNPADAFVGVQGILDVTVFKIDTVYPAVASANITLDPRHIATISTIDVTIT